MLLAVCATRISVLPRVETFVHGLKLFLYWEGQFKDVDGNGSLQFSVLLLIQNTICN